MHLTLWYIVLVCHQVDVCENYICSVYCGLSESGLRVFRRLCLVSFLVVCKLSSVLLQSLVMSYVGCGDDGYVVAPNGTAYRRWSCHGTSSGCPIYRFLGKPVIQTHWMAGADYHKSGYCRDKSRSDNHTHTTATQT